MKSSFLFWVAHHDPSSSRHCPSLQLGWILVFHSFSICEGKIIIWFLLFEIRFDSKSGCLLITRAGYSHGYGHGHSCWEPPTLSWTFGSMFNSVIQWILDFGMFFAWFLELKQRPSFDPLFWILRRCLDPWTRTCQTRYWFNLLPLKS